MQVVQTPEDRAHFRRRWTRALADEAVMRGKPAPLYVTKAHPWHGEVKRRYNHIVVDEEQDPLKKAWLSAVLTASRGTSLVARKGTELHAAARAIFEKGSESV